MRQFKQLRLWEIFYFVYEAGTFLRYSRQNGRFGGEEAADSSYKLI